MKGALDVHRTLLALDVPHEVVRLRGRLAHADDLPGVLDLATGCVTVRCYVVSRSDGAAFVAALVPAGEVPSPTLLLEALDACSVRPATPTEVNAATDYAAGLVCPVCLPDDVGIVADLALGDARTSYCALGEGGVALGIGTDDLLRTTRARCADLTGAARAERVIDLGRAGPAWPDEPGRTSGRTTLRPPAAEQRGADRGRTVKR